MSASENQIVVYQPNETVRLDVRLENETVWLTQAQLCELFQRDVSVISRHIKNIFAEGELENQAPHALPLLSSPSESVLWHWAGLACHSCLRDPSFLHWQADLYH